jgi:hypothetical protein
MERRNISTMLIWIKAATAEKNLLLCPKKEHAEIHNQLDSIVSELIKDEVIIFNSDKRHYERKK